MCSFQFWDQKCAICCFEECCISEQPKNFAKSFSCDTFHKRQCANTSTGDDTAMAQGFTTVDYVVFALMLLVSAGIGVWYGCGPGGRQTSTKEYLLADRSMRVVPVAISLLVTFLSAIALIGIPAEIYTFGTQYFMAILSTLIMGPPAAIVFVPMYRRLKVTSVTEVNISLCPLLS